MTRRIGQAALAAWLVALLSIAAPAAAQQDRSGFSFGLGGGYGSASVSCEGCGETTRQASPAGYLRAGYSANRRVVFGVEFNLWSTTGDLLDLDAEATLNIYNVSGTVMFYPRPDRGFFVKGGAGASFIDIELKLPGSSLTADLGRGPGLIVGAGYDLALGRRVAVTVGSNFWYGRPGDLNLLGEAFAAKWQQNVADLTVGITFP